MKISHAIGRALEIVSAKPMIAPAEFASQMWPQSACWQKVYKTGNRGASRGVAMFRAAGAYLGRLRSAGLIDFKTRLTVKGTTALAAYRKAKRAAGAKA